MLAAPSIARAQHPPEQPQAQTELQHSHVAASSSLSDAMKIEGKVANSDLPGWKTRDFLIRLKAPWAVLNQGLQGWKQLLLGSYLAGLWTLYITEPALWGLCCFLFQRWRFIHRQYRLKKLVEFKCFLKHNHHLSAIKATGLAFIPSQMPKCAGRRWICISQFCASELSFFMLMCSFPFCKLALTWPCNE